MMDAGHAELAELDTAIDGIVNMTERLRELHEVRARYTRAFGIRQSRATFSELDRALRALRKAAR